jgi:hypothetical protein
MNVRLLGLALVLAATPLAAQGNAADPDKAVKQAGAMPDGWMGATDRPGQKVADANFVQMGKGMHVTSGPAAVYWNTANVAPKGPWSFGASFGQRVAPEHPEAYGLVWAADKLGTPEASYLYYIVRGDGKYMVRHRANATEIHDITPWTDSPALNKNDPTKNGAATNVLEVRVAADSVRLMANGKQVTAYATKTLGYGEGTYGFRINHNLNVHISDFGKR